MKKVISLILATLMLLSMASFVSADTTYGTFTLPSLTTADVAGQDYDGTDYYKVDVKLKDLMSYNGTDFFGYDAAQFDVVYDATKLEAGKAELTGRAPNQVRTVAYGDTKSCKLFTYNGDGEVDEAPSLTISNPEVSGKKVIRVILTVKTGCDLEGQDEAVVATVYFRPVSGATGDAELSLGYTEFAGNSSAYQHKTFASNKGKISLGVPPTEYTVTASANEYGSVNKASQTTVGGAASITATGDVVNEGLTGEVTYVIDDILVNNVTIGETALAAYKGENEVTYPLTGVAANTSVKFIFKPATAEVSYLRMLTPYTEEGQQFNNAVLIGGQFVPGSDAADYVDGKFGVEAYSIKESKTVYYPANDISDYGFFFVGLYDGVYRQGISSSIVDAADGLRVFAETKDGETKIFDKEN